MTSDAEKVRAQEWVFHYLRGNVREALDVELSGPPIKPNAVMLAVIHHLADEHAVLLPIRDKEKP